MNKDIKIAIVEDEPITVEFLKGVIKNMGFGVLFVCSNAKDALFKSAEFTPDLLFVDINLNGAMDGISFVKELILSGCEPSIIYISAYNDKQTVEEASRTLPCWFLSKPFSQQDIEIALMISIKRLESKKGSDDVVDINILRLGDGYIFNFDKKILYKDESAIRLTAKELSMLMILCKRVDGLVTNMEICEYVWNDKSVSESTIRDLVYRLRKKAPEINIESIPSLGYRLVKQ